MVEHGHRHSDEMIGWTSLGSVTCKVENGDLSCVFMSLVVTSDWPSVVICVLVTLDAPGFTIRRVVDGNLSGDLVSVDVNSDWPSVVMSVVVTVECPGFVISVVFTVEYPDVVILVVVTVADMTSWKYKQFNIEKNQINLCALVRLWGF